MTITIRGISYDFANAPKFVRKNVALMIELNGTNMDAAPDAVLHKAHILAQRWAIAS